MRPGPGRFGRLPACAGLFATLALLVVAISAAGLPDATVPLMVTAFAFAILALSTAIARRDGRLPGGASTFARATSGGETPLRHTDPDAPGHVRPRAPTGVVRAS